MLRVTSAALVYAPGTSSQNVGAPANPPYKNAPGHRSRAAYDKVIDQFSVSTNPRYFIRDTSGDGIDDTFCNIFAWDVMSAMNVQLPHWVFGDGRPAPAGYGNGGYELDANGVNGWLHGSGPQHGWKKITEAEAQRYANLGMPVVASQNNAPGIGHVGVVRPGEATNGPALAQAGARNLNHAHVYDTFSRGRVEFFVNLNGGAPPPVRVPEVNLKRGDKGPNVKLLKVALYRLGYVSKAMLDAHPDEYGSGTEAAVKRFQKDYGLRVSGSYGSGTRAKLKAALAGTALRPPVEPGSKASGAKIDTLVRGTGLQGQGAAIARLSEQYRVPAELALAMFWHEAQFMSTGIAPMNNNPGNLRFVGQPGAVSGVRGFARWPTAEQGLEAYFKLMSTVYRPFIDRKDWAGLVHKYAPSSDGNDEAQYVRKIVDGMNAYRPRIY